MFHGMTTTNNFTDKISNEEAAALPAIEFRGEIRIVDNERDIVPACKFLMKQRVIGFDTETRPSFRPGVTFRVSLLQLSTPQYASFSGSTRSRSPSRSCRCSKARRS